MKRKLAAIARELSEEDLQELLRIRKTGDKKVDGLRKKRDKLAADLAKAEAELAQLTGGAETRKKRRGRKPGRPAAAEGAARAKPGRKPGAKKAAKKGPGRGGKRRVNFTAAVRDVFVSAGTPLRAAEVVERLAEAGAKIKDTADMKKRVSVILASQKNSFEQVDRGLYQLKP